MWNLGQPQATPSQQAGDWRFRRLMEVLPSAAYACDTEGFITSYNQRAVELWGRRPELNNSADRYCGSYKLFATDGSPILHNRCWMALALQEGHGYNQMEIVIERPDGSRRTALTHANPICDESDRLIGAVNVLVDITDRRTAEEEVRTLNTELEERVRQRTATLETTARELREALERIRTLRGLVPICSWCKKIRDDRGFWQRLESFLQTHTDAELTHGVCPDCAKKHYGGRHIIRVS